jgi:iodothyronine deiodinase-like protein
LGELEEMAERYAGRVAFFVVYIKEAHPEDGWVLASNREEGIEVADPATPAERSACALRVRTRLPVLIDGLDNETARQYGGWPDRLYLVGRDGQIAFQGDEGPSGFNPDELERAIQTELAAQ